MYSVGISKRASRASTDISIANEKTARRLLIRWRPGSIRFFRENGLAGQRLLAWANGSGQSAVVNTVGIVPQGLAQLDAATENFDFFGASGGGIGGLEMMIFIGNEVFVMTVT
jgi:hypothetical protein